MRASYWARSPLATICNAKFRCRYASSQHARLPVRRPTRTSKLAQNFSSTLEPPVALFSSALYGETEFDCAEALDIARKCIAAVQNNTQSSSLDVKSIDINLRKIAIVTAILDRSPSHKTVSRFVRTALARAGEPLSINTLASKLIHSSSINNQPWLIQKVETLAREGNSWKAMVLYGMILLEKGQPDEAANWYQSAMNAVKPIETPSSLQTILNAVALVKSPFEAYAELKLKLEQVDEARKAAEVGVSQYNNSGCHKLLASILSSNNQDHDKAEGHLMKSAMSRDPNACHVLGQIYRLKHLGLKQAENDPFYQVLFASRKISPGLILDRSPYISTAEYYRMAKEWLELAAYEGVAMASLQMAILLRQENKLQDGLAYLDRVGDDSKYTQVVANLREIWITPDADTSSILLASHQL